MASKLAPKRLHVLSRYLTSVNQVHYSTAASKPSIDLSRRWAPSPTIQLTKNQAMIDEKVQVKVRGLGEGQKVTLHSYLSESGKLFAACGHYEANEKGEVDSFQHDSHGGTFQGNEPMGLFWSMESQNTKKPKRILKEDVTTPFDVKIAVHDGFVNFEELPWSDDFPCLSDCVLQRHYTAPGVRRIPVRENGLYGTLFLPPGEGPFPAVIDIFGLTGGVLETRSSLLASNGIAAFSLGYVNCGDLPKSEHQLDYKYFLRAFDWLAGHPEVDGKALGGISTCVGGGYLGVIAMKRPSMKCVVSVNGPYAPFATEQTLEGELIKSSSFDLSLLSFSKEGVIFRTLFQEDQEQVFSPIWRHGAKVLLIHCSDDQSVHPAMAKKFLGLVPTEFKDNFTHIEYQGAGHLLEPPFMPLCKSSFNEVLKQYMVWGGEPKAQADAQEDSWPRILDFLHTHLRQ